MICAVALLVATSADATVAQDLALKLRRALDVHSAQAVHALADPAHGVWFWRVKGGLWPEPARHVPPSGLAPDEALDDDWFSNVRDLLGLLADRPPPLDLAAPSWFDPPFVTLETRNLRAKMEPYSEYGGANAARALKPTMRNIAAVLESSDEGNTLLVVFTRVRGRLRIAHVMLMPHEA